MYQWLIVPCCLVGAVVSFLIFSIKQPLAGWDGKVPGFFVTLKRSVGFC